MDRSLIGGSLGLLATALVAGVLLANQGDGVPYQHLDGQGALGSVLAPGGHEGGAYPADVTVPVSFGIQLCLARGTEPAVIDGIAPVESVGSGIVMLGALVRTFRPDTVDLPQFSGRGFPPSGISDSFAPLVGYAVRSPCGDHPSEYTEAQIGFRRSGPSGGGWRGIDISYHVGGRRHVVRLGYDFLFCGTAMIEECSGAPSS